MCLQSATLSSHETNAGRESWQRQNHLAEESVRERSAHRTHTHIHDPSLSFLSGQRGLQENWMEARLPADLRKIRNLSTVGIVVSDWTYTKRVHDGQTQTGLRNITFMTWDFGGQVG